ncbi:MAG: aminotransferase class I/II-fold pyridoxal phosphate-dependent enzyme [Clostridia bacterium]|nr:aminotransferase class I/II-fold pyridoxal phosphate-dependent enzyme [Clostridia bacterium]
MNEIQAIALLKECERDNKALFDEIDETALYNTEKVLAAFRECRVAERHLKGTTGYGYGDIGRETLNKVFAMTLGAEDAIASPYFASGTHALKVSLYGMLRPGDTLLSVTGAPYDTLMSVITEKGIGSLADYNVTYKQVDLTKDGDFDYPAIEKALSCDPKIVFLTRSRGYSDRDAFSIERLGKAIQYIKARSRAIVFVDNCYGEFTEKSEPTAVGADVIVGSFTKNIGGGLAPSGGYAAGRKDLVEQIAFSLTAPSLGTEIGSYAPGYQNFFQGLFLAPHVVACALKGSILFGSAFDKMGYRTIPSPGKRCGDIIRSIVFEDPDKLIRFCQIIQSVSPIDAYVLPEPWDMPGYKEQVIMAAGTFVGGASLELTADAPIKPPYIAYVQGGLTIEHIKLALIKCIEEFGDQ